MLVSLLFIVIPTSFFKFTIFAYILYFRSLTGLLYESKIVGITYNHDRTEYCQS